MRGMKDQQPNIYTTAFLGLDTPQLNVEADIRPGLPQIQIVGLSAARGKAIHERIRAEPLNCGFKVPDQRITINLSPADLPMDLPGYDLPIGLALLARSQQLPKSDAGGSTSRRWHFGQSCGGRTRSSNGPWVVVTMKLNGRG